MTCTLIESYLYVRILMKENSRKGKRNTGAGDDACPECLYGLCVWIWGDKSVIIYIPALSQLSASPDKPSTPPPLPSGDW